MTRAQGTGSGIAYRSVSPAGATRCVVVLRSGALATVDPAPQVTAAHATRLLLVQVDASELDDPPTFGGETPAGSAAAEVLALLREEVPDGTFGVVGERAAALFAAALAAQLGPRVDRLALVSAPMPDGPLACDLTAGVLSQVSSVALVVNASTDPGAPAEAAQWYAAHLRRGRAEAVPAADPHPLDGRLALSDVWDRVLGHVGTAVARP
jgi:pimeloyl-ACP methyl ester carboxylesterase